jgi:hypothetical protein
MTRVYADQDGNSHFADMDISFALTPLASGLPEMHSSQRFPATTFQLVATTPATMARGWHPAPRRQFACFLKGALAVEVSDGDIRQFATGSLLFFEDTWGKGHLNHRLNDEDILLGFVAVPDDAPFR